MDDRIVVALSKSLNELGASVIRFNFRGVGRSEGRSEGDRAEVSDAAAVFDWASLKHPNHKIIICGYSFGASISYDLASKRCVEGMVLIAPPPIFLEKRSKSVKESLLILASRDQFVPVEPTESFFRDILDSIQLLEDDHFFTNTLDELKKQLENFLRRNYLEYKVIEFKKRDQIATIALNRPDRLNAWTMRMHIEYRHALRALMKMPT